MILILCEASDRIGRAFQPLLAAAAAPEVVEILTTAELVYSPSITHLFGGCAPAESSVDTRRFGKIKDYNLSGVVNRIDILPQKFLAAIAESDRLYVAQEFQAAMASWLQALSCPVFNRPSASWLGGPYFSRAVWENHAAIAGLYVAETSIDIDCSLPALPPPAHRVVVFGEKIYGQPQQHETTAPCVRLARLSGCNLLEILLGADLAFIGATPLTDLTLGGECLAEDLAAAFEGSKS